MFQTLSRRTVLCIGSEDACPEFLSTSLKDFVLVFARSGLDAVRTMNARVFDGYVTDFWLPDWSGVQVCREVRKTDPSCPVVVYTAAAGNDKMSRAKRAGANAYVPLDDLVVLKRTLRTLLANADSKSLRAKPCMEEAAFAEFARCAGAAGDGGNALAPSFIETKARTRAYAAFLKAGGTRAHFERWWPQIFASTRARYALDVSPA